MIWPSGDRKSTRLNSSHMSISYAVFCLKKKKNEFSALDLDQKNFNLSHRGGDGVPGDTYGRIISHLDQRVPLEFLEIFFFNDTPTTEIYTLSLHDALPI